MFKIHKLKLIIFSDTHPDSQCRFCLQQETATHDYMVAPCGCTGSVRLVHLSCLQKWVQSRCSIKISGICTTYHWKNTNCEVCHKNLPGKSPILTLIANFYPIKDYLQWNDAERVPLFDHPKLEIPNFIVLESISKDNDNSKTLHVLNMVGLNEPVKFVAKYDSSNSNFYIKGRGHECDIRISDISVSRLHAIIRFSSGNYYLEDNSAKFGTLVLIKHPIVLDPHFNPAIQIGRTVFSFALKANPQQPPSWKR